VGSISGKVTFKGQPLKGGHVTFVHSKGATVSEIKEDGSYSVAGVPSGTAKIAVETESLNPAKMARIPRNTPPKGANSPNATANAPPDPKEMAKHFVAIPERYSDADKSGLTYEVKGGSQDYTIPLQ